MVTTTLQRKDSSKIFWILVVWSITIMTTMVTVVQSFSTTRLLPTILIPRRLHSNLILSSSSKPFFVTSPDDNEDDEEENNNNNEVVVVVDDDESSMNEPFFVMSPDEEEEDENNHNNNNEEVVDNDDTESSMNEPSQQDQLRSLLSYIHNYDEDKLSCGLDATEKEQTVIQSIIDQVENDDSNNLVIIQNGQITFQDIVGDWKLLYTSSRTMINNKSLSGLGGRSSSSSEDMGAQFDGLVQKLSGNKFLGTVELIETFGNDDDEDSLFEVTITGEWFLLPETNVLTGVPCTSLSFELEQVQYGSEMNSADDWSSLGPMKRVDILYLSKDILITRGNVNTDSLFVWERIK